MVDDFVWHENEIMQQNVNVFSNICVEQVKHVKIIVNSVNRHVNGSLDLIFMPGKIINHTALVNTFDKYYEDEIVQLVHFNKDANTRYLYPCQARADLGMENPLKIYEGESNETDTAIYLTHTTWWADQNHFTTVQYYRDMITHVGLVPRFPEDPMKVAARKDCRLNGTHWYGLPNDGKYICHLDANGAYRMGICPKSFWESD